MSITLQAAEDIRFMIQGKDGVGERQVSIPEYYKSYYGAVVTKPRLPCVQVGEQSIIEPLLTPSLTVWEEGVHPTRIRKLIGIQFTTTYEAHC
jgi:hypothetical protein